ncbi:MAG: ABC transporter permease [Bacteroidota bacterium]
MAFDLEKSLAVWRRPYEVNAAFSAEDIEELENGLRERIKTLVDAGTSVQEAFQIAIKRTGSYGNVEREYQKVFWGKVKRERRLLPELSWRVSMLKSYLKTALRTLKKERVYGFINIFGFAIGLTCFILISLFVRYEFGYDDFHEKADRIYRVAEVDPTGYYLGSNQYTDTPAPLLRALEEAFPEVDVATQLRKVKALLTHDGKQFYENGIYATPQFFDVFSFPIIQGDRGKALTDPNTVILTASLAQKYFGAANPIGQLLTFTPSAPWWSTPPPVGVDMQVVGVMADIPANTHLSFDYIISMSSSADYARHIDQWDNSNYFTYAALHSGFSLEHFKSKLAVVAKQHLAPDASAENHPEEIVSHFPQALTDIHLRSTINSEFGANGDIRYVFLFLGIALLVLLVAGINYVNLSIARSLVRAREFGVRKAIGASRKQLIGQFMGEALLPAILALILALVLLVVLLPAFNTLTSRSISLADNSMLLVLLVAIGLGVGILAGSYPAFRLSMLHPVHMMKGKLSQYLARYRVRNVLVVVQFSITIVLIIGTLVIWQQLSFIQGAETGIDREQVISIEINDPNLRGRITTVKEALQADASVLSVSASHHDPIYIDAQSDTRAWQGAAEGQEVSVYHSNIHYGYLDMFGVDLTEGRDFSAAIVTDQKQGLLINETLRKQLGWNEAVGRSLTLNGTDHHIVGVMRDFNFQSFRQKVAPLALYLDPGDYSRVFVKAGTEDIIRTLGFLQETMTTLSPAYPFTYSFLDSQYDQMYQADAQFGRLIGYFTLLAIVIGCLGLLGLASYMVAKRTKEIGIRKVLGASHTNVLFLVSKDFTLLVVIAFVLSAPVAFYAMHVWLNGFAYRIAISWQTLLIAGALTLVLAWLTVSYHTIKATLANPTKTLRNG